MHWIKAHLPSAAAAVARGFPGEDWYGNAKADALAKAGLGCHPTDPLCRDRFTSFVLLVRSLHVHMLSTLRWIVASPAFVAHRQARAAVVAARRAGRAFRHGGTLRCRAAPRAVRQGHVLCPAGSLIVCRACGRWRDPGAVWDIVRVLCLRCANLCPPSDRFSPMDTRLLCSPFGPLSIPGIV